MNSNTNNYGNFSQNPPNNNNYQNQKPVLENNDNKKPGNWRNNNNNNFGNGNNNNNGGNERNPYYTRAQARKSQVAVAEIHQEEDKEDIKNWNWIKVRNFRKRQKTRSRRISFW